MWRMRLGALVLVGCTASHDPSAVLLPAGSGLYAEAAATGIGAITVFLPTDGQCTLLVVSPGSGSGLAVDQGIGGPADGRGRLVESDCPEAYRQWVAAGRGRGPSVGTEVDVRGQMRLIGMDATGVRFTISGELAYPLPDEPDIERRIVIEEQATGSAPGF